MNSIAIAALVGYHAARIILIMAESSSPAPIAEIDHGPSKTDQFLDNHQKKLVIGAILIAVGVIAYVIYDGLAEAKAQAAGSALLTAEKINDYQGVINQWPESNSAASALPLIADLQWTESQPESIGTLRKFISEHPGHPTIATAKTSLGLRLLEQGKTDEAKEVLTEVTDNQDSAYIAPLASITLGDIAKAAGETTEAKQWYEKAQEDPIGLGNAFKGTANLRLALVNAQPPVKIKPALPEPPKPPAPPAPPEPRAENTPATGDDIAAPVLVKPDTPESTTPAEKAAKTPNTPNTTKP